MQTSDTFTLKQNLNEMHLYNLVLLDCVSLNRADAIRKCPSSVVHRPFVDRHAIISEHMLGWWDALFQISLIGSPEPYTR